MNWREIDWNIVTLGRVIGVVIIAVGILLSALDASAIDTRGISGSVLGSHYTLRYFLHGVVEYLWRGGLIIVAAEVAERIGWGRGDEQDAADENLSTS